ncbi:MAG TPA: ATP-binding protein [Ilumatobacteraceae bacterium]|nr:ATP-binding protein [Ilumatobacteraceae bacterium]
MIERPHDSAALKHALARSPVVLLVGARQTGKTTMARSILSSDDEAYFDLEDPRDLARLDEPMVALEGLSGVVVIDEVQRRPDLFPILRVLADRPAAPATFLVLGSASPSALRQAAESLAGRLEILELGGLGIGDVGANRFDELWLRGGFPRSFLAADNPSSIRWRINYIRTLATRDIPEFGVRLPSATIERFLALVAHAHGQLWNGAEPARALGIAETTVRKYLDVLADMMLVRVLQPWHENLAKRQVRSPKVYFRDSGLVHTLLGIDGRVELLRHARVGASWEGVVIEECIRQADDTMTPYFWRTSNGAELDLLLVRGDKRMGIEVKRTDAPRITPSIRSALADLQLDRITVYYPGRRSYTLSEQVDVVPVAELAVSGGQGRLG